MNELPRIITADCSSPKEIDDGLFVEQLDDAHELYRVGVCVVDTSSVYKERAFVEQAFERTAAKYWVMPDGEQGYDPMIEPEVIKGLEFTAGNVRDALIATFMVGRLQSPAGIDLSFGKVEVAENKNYKEFAHFAATDEGQKFYRASKFIKQHLGYVAYGDHTGQRPGWRMAQATSSVSEQAWKRGSKINEAFMVATNHLTGKTLAEEGRPAIYRVHNPEDEQYLEMLSASVGRYTRKPGPHDGLGLDVYCRVTSPLRRLDDFMMNYQLKRRYQGQWPSGGDVRDLAFAIRRLNQETIAAAPKDVSRFSRRDILGRASVAAQAELTG